MTVDGRNEKLQATPKNSHFLNVWKNVMCKFSHSRATFSQKWRTKYANEKVKERDTYTASFTSVSARCDQDRFPRPRPRPRPRFPLPGGPRKNPCGAAGLGGPWLPSLGAPRPRPAPRPPLPPPPAENCAVAEP